MFKRFIKIRNEFGNVALFRIVFVGIGMLGMSGAGIYFYSRIDMFLATLAITVVVFKCRNQISNHVGSLANIFKVGFVVYGVVLFFGDSLGIANDWKLFIITVATALVFNLQFWSLSDPDVYKIADE